MAATKEDLMTATKTEIVSARSISKEKNAINAKTTTSDFLFAKLVIVMLMDQLINNATKMELVHVKRTSKDQNVRNVNPNFTDILIAKLVIVNPDPLIIFVIQTVFVVAERISVETNAIHVKLDTLTILHAKVCIFSSYCNFTAFLFFLLRM